MKTALIAQFPILFRLVRSSAIPASLVAALAVALPASAAPPVTTAGLLGEMTDLSGMAEFPDPPYTCQQFSSYDRASKSPSENWFANADCGQLGLWQCLTGPSYPGGYCTPIPQCSPANGLGCTPGSSVCFDPAGAPTPYCVDRCTGTGQGTCRAGYTCAVIGNARGCVP